MIRTDKQTLNKVRRAAALNKRAGDWVAKPPHPSMITLTPEQMRKFKRDRKVK